MLLKRLAVGGMAELFLANDSSTGEQVVIKRILPYLSHEPEFVQMFLDEARIAAQLHHPNIIQVHELGKLQESMFIAMEFVDGTDLRKIFQEEVKLGLTVPYGVAALVTAKVCAGLYFAHNATGMDGRPLGVIHRDISPQNVMVGFDGKVKLVDFGIAKASALMERSKPGVIKGKFLYLSPEQLSQERVDHRADLFALGSMLYELTIGKSPFYKPTTEAVIYSIRSEEPQPPTLLRSDYPPELARIVMKCLVKDRNQRYQQASEIQADLEAFLKANLPTDEVALRSYVQRLFGKTEESRTHVIPPVTKKPTGRKDPTQELPGRKASNAAMPAAEPIGRVPSNASAPSEEGARAAAPLARKPTMTSGKPMPEPKAEARTKLASPDELPRATNPVGALPMRKPSSARYQTAGTGGPEQSVTHETLDVVNDGLPPAPEPTGDNESEMTLPPEDAARAHQLQLQRGRDRAFEYDDEDEDDGDGEQTIPLPAVKPRKGTPPPPPSRGGRLGADGPVDATGPMPPLAAGEDDDDDDDGGTPLMATPLLDAEDDERSTATVSQAPRSKARRTQPGAAGSTAGASRKPEPSPARWVIAGIIALIVVGAAVIYYLVASGEGPPVTTPSEPASMAPPAAPSSEGEGEAARQPPPSVRAPARPAGQGGESRMLSLVFDGPRGAVVTLGGEDVPLGVATEALPGLIEYEYRCPGRRPSKGAVQLDESAIGTPVHIPLNCRSR